MSAEIKMLNRFNLVRNIFYILSCSLFFYGHKNLRKFYDMPAVFENDLGPISEHILKSRYNVKFDTMYLLIFLGLGLLFLKKTKKIASVILFISLLYFCGIYTGFGILDSVGLVPTFIFINFIFMISYFVEQTQMNVIKISKFLNFYCAIIFFSASYSKLFYSGMNWIRKPHLLAVLKGINPEISQNPLWVLHALSNDKTQITLQALVLFFEISYLPLMFFKLPTQIHEFFLLTMILAAWITYGVSTAAFIISMGIILSLKYFVINDLIKDYD